MGKKIKTAFSSDRCFICGEKLNGKNKSVEHVYPRWLQKKFNLWNQKLKLLNNTAIEYRFLTVPCCKSCNLYYYGEKIEKPIERACSGGFEEFVKIDEKIIFQWLNKISYGTLFKELFLKMEMSNPDSKTIYKKEFLKEHKMQISFLQSVISNTKFLGEMPWSIFLFKIKTNGEKTYNAQDILFNKNCFFMQLNDIGIISSLSDGGVIKKSLEEYMKPYKNVQLHPIQFAELCAIFSLRAFTLKTDPYFTVVRKLPSNKITQIICSNGHHRFEEITLNDYTEVLMNHLKPYYSDNFPTYDENRMYKGESYYLRNVDNSIRDISFEQNK